MKKLIYSKEDVDLIVSLEIQEKDEEIERLNHEADTYMKIAVARQKRIDKAIEYIMKELITEWDIENDGYVSGSDLPADAITPLLDILRGEE